MKKSGIENFEIKKISIERCNRIRGGVAVFLGPLGLFLRSVFTVGYQVFVKPLFDKPYKLDPVSTPTDYDEDEYDPWD